MRECPTYTSGETVADETQMKSGREKRRDFDRLALRFEDEESQEKKNKLLEEIHIRIECDMNLALLEAKKNPTYQSYWECTELVRLMVKYNMNITVWREKIDNIFPISFFREFELQNFRNYMKELRGYSETSSNVDHIYIFEQSYRWAQSTMSTLESMGIPKIELEKELDTVLERFLGLYLEDSIKLAGWYIEGRAILRMSVNANPISEWRRDTEEALKLYARYKGNVSQEYQVILQKYRDILPKMLNIEAEIALQLLDVDLKNIEESQARDPREKNSF